MRGGRLIRVLFVVLYVLRGSPIKCSLDKRSASADPLCGQHSADADEKQAAKNLGDVAALVTKQ